MNLRKVTSLTMLLSFALCILTSIEKKKECHGHSGADDPGDCWIC
ncbi:MAG: hypothetical protein ABIJ50_06395 [Pseudomonadota bacterium]